MSKKWYEDDSVGGFIHEDGTFEVCFVNTLTHADIDAYAVEVQNGEGYYDEDGWYHSYGKDGWFDY